MKNLLVILQILLVFNSCNSDSVNNRREIKETNSVDTISYSSSEETNSTQNTGKDKIRSGAENSLVVKEENQNSYLVKKFSNTKLYGASAFELSKEELEKRLIEEFANIDPLEYYLQNNAKFTDKKAMFKKKDELTELIEIYRKKYYDKGHLQEMRDNNAILISLISDAYPEELYKKYDSISNKFNSNLTSFKKSNSQSISSTSQSPLSELNYAVQLLNKKRYTEANTILTDLVSSDLVNDYLANYNKAFASYNLNNFNDAIKYANRSILSRQDFYLGYLLLGESHLSVGDFNQALIAFKKALGIKENVVSLERTAYASSLKGDFTSALSYYSRILELYHGTGQRNYNALIAYTRIPKGEQEESVATSKYLSAIHVDWAVPYLIVAFNELYLGNNNEAAKYFNQAKDLGEYFYSNLGLAITYYNSRDFTKASDMFLSLNGKSEFDKLRFHKELLLLQIFSHANNNKYPECLDKLIDYAHYHEKDEYYYLGMSLVSYDLYNFKKAELYLDSIRNFNIFDSDYLYLKGVVALRNNNHSVARAYFEKSLKKESNLRALNGLGGVFNEKGDYKSAMKLFEEGLLEDRNNPYLLFNKASSLCLMGKDYYAQGDTVNARQTVEFGCDLLRKAKSLNNRFVIDLNIGNAYANIHDSTNAIRYYNYVGNSYSEVNIGVAYANTNKLSKAKEIWEAVNKVDPNVDLAKANLIASSMSTPKYTYYYYYYYDVSVDIKISVPVLFDEMFEPLVPLGHSRFQFSKLTKD
jgi:tetratricopeptide (TPR) repeat protein